MIAQTYVCFKDGAAEFGYTFKLAEDADDSEFDIPLGESDDANVMDAAWEAFAPKAKRIAEALTDKE
jgi:hypothetical protein